MLVYHHSNTTVTGSMLSDLNMNVENRILANHCLK